MVLLAVCLLRSRPSPREAAAGRSECARADEPSVRGRSE